MSRTISLLGIGLVVFVHSVAPADTTVEANPDRTLAAGDTLFPVARGIRLPSDGGFQTPSLRQTSSGLWWFGNQHPHVQPLPGDRLTTSDGTHVSFPIDLDFTGACTGSSGNWALNASALSSSNRATTSGIGVQMSIGSGLPYTCSSGSFSSADTVHAVPWTSLALSGNSKYCVRVAERNGFNLSYVSGYIHSISITLSGFPPTQFCNYARVERAQPVDRRKSAE